MGTVARNPVTDAPRRSRREPVMRRRYLGSWVLPSGNSCDVYLELTTGALACEWDTPPSPAWSPGDRAHYETVTFPEILRAVVTATGQSVLGVQA
jgi:hypothetical protein